MKISFNLNYFLNVGYFKKDTVATKRESGERWLDFFGALQSVYTLALQKLIMSINSVAITIYQPEGWKKLFL